MKRALLIFGIALCASASAQQVLKATGNLGAKGNLTIGVSNVIVTPADFFVSPATGTPVAPCSNGSDSNAGTTVGAPFATLHKAITAVRALAGTKTITVDLCGGSYYGTNLTGANALTSLDSGSAVAPIVYQAYPGHSVLISGGIRLSGAFTFTSSSTGPCNQFPSTQTNCWVATLPSSYATTNYFERLWYSNAPRYTPRTGVSGLSSITGQYGTINATQPGFPVISYTAGDPGTSGIASWTNLNDVHVWDFERWVANVFRLASVNAGAHTVTTTCLAGHSGNTGCPSGGFPGTLRSGNMLQFENVKELFGASTEQFYLDRLCGGCSSAPKLYYNAVVGENPNTDSPGIVVGQNARVMDITGAQWITFQNLNFAHDNWSSSNGVNGGYASTQLDPFLNYANTNSQNLASAMISCNPCTHVTFTYDSFFETTLHAIEFLNGSSSDAVTNSAFWDIGGSAVKIGNASSSGTAPTNISIINNAIAGVGRVIPAADGIAGGVAQNVEVAFNDISHTAHDGVEVCKPGATGQSANGHGVCTGVSGWNIHDNWIHDIMEGTTSDGGCVYMMMAQATGGSSSGNFVSHNSCFNVNDQRTQTVNNAGYSGDGYGGNCFYLDQDTGNVTVQNNLCYRATGTALSLTNGPAATLQPDELLNNISAFVITAVAGPQNASTASNIKQLDFTNNIVLMDHYPSGSNYFPQHAAGAWFFSAAPTLIQNYANNVYFNSSGSGYGVTNPQFFQCSTSACAGKSVFSSFAQWQNGSAFVGSPASGEDSGSTVTTNPGFTAPAACTPVNDALNYPYPNPGVCDDYTFPGHVAGDLILGGRFTVFNVGAATSSTPGSGFGQYPPGGTLPPVGNWAAGFTTSVYPVSNF